MEKTPCGSQPSSHPVGCTPSGLSTRCRLGWRCLLQVLGADRAGHVYLAASRDAQPSLIAIKINAFCFISQNRGISLRFFFFFSSVCFFFFSFLRPPSKSSLPPPSAASFPCKQAHGTHSLTHHTHGNTLMALQRRALPGAGTGLAAHAAAGGGRAGRGKDARHQEELSASHMQARRRVSARRLQPLGLQSASQRMRCGGWCEVSPHASRLSDTAALCRLPEQ